MDAAAVVTRRKASVRVSRTLLDVRTLEDVFIVVHTAHLGIRLEVCELVTVRRSEVRAWYRVQEHGCLEFVRPTHMAFSCGAGPSNCCIPQAGAGPVSCNGLLGGTYGGTWHERFALLSRLGSTGDLRGNTEHIVGDVVDASERDALPGLELEFYLRSARDCRVAY